MQPQMPSSDNQQAPIDESFTKQGYSWSSLVTTGFVSAVFAFSASLLYFHYFPQVQKTPAPIAVVDMVKLGVSITDLQKRSNGETTAFLNAGHAIEMLREKGFIVLDSRLVITAPSQYIKEPSELVKGANDDVGVSVGYLPPNLMQGVESEHN